MDTDDCRARILTYLDDKMVNDSSFVNKYKWELKPFTIMGYYENLKKGSHKINI